MIPQEDFYLEILLFAADGSQRLRNKRIGGQATEIIHMEQEDIIQLEL